MEDSPEYGKGFAFVFGHGTANIRKGKDDEEDQKARRKEWKVSYAKGSCYRGRRIYRIPFM